MSKFKKKQKKFESFRVKFKVEAINYQKDEYGIFRCSPIDSSKEVKLSYSGQFNLKGNVPYDLKVGKVYTVYMGNPEFNEKYKNYTYEVDKFEVEQLTKPEEQFEFLQTVTNDSIYQQLVEQYPNTCIIDLIFADQIDLSKIKGLAEKSYQKLKEDLDMYKDLGKLQNLLAPLGVTIKAVTKIANHYDSPDRAYKILKESLYNLCEVKGYGFKKVDELCLKAKVPTTDPIRISECLKYIIDSNTADGHSWSYRDDIMTQALELLNIEPELIDSILNNAPYSKDKYYKPNDIIVVGELVSLYRLYKDEHNTLMNLIRIRDNYVPPVLEDIDSSINRAEDKLMVKYTEEQRETIKEAIQHGVYIINGKSGAGKTTIIRGITEVLDDCNRTYHGAVLSGKGSMVMSSKGIPSSTIHRLLKYDGEGFKHDEENPVPYNTVILDEASMTDANLWNHITNAISNGGQILCVGDSGQLPNLSGGDIMRDLLGSSIFKQRELQKIHRQAADSGVVEIAHKIRNGEQLTSFNKEITDKYGIREDLSIIARNKPKKENILITEWMSEEDIKEAQNPIYQISKQIVQSQIDKIKQSENPEQGIMDFQVISPNRTTGALSTDSMNKLIQREYNKSKKFIKLGKTTFFENDKILVNGNNYNITSYSSIEDYNNKNVIMEDKIRIVTSIDENGKEFEMEERYTGAKEQDLFNGTLGLVKYIDVDNEIMLVQFEGIEGLIAMDDEASNSLDLGYAMTIHKCVTPDTLIVSNKGLISLEESFNDNDISIHNGRIMQKPISKVEFKDEKTIKLISKRGFKLEGTLDHRIMTYGKNGELLPITLEELKLDTPIVIRKGTNIYGEVTKLPNDFSNRVDLDVRTTIYNRPTELDEKLSLLLGMIASDGTIADVKVMYAKKHNECVQLFRELIGELFSYHIGKIYDSGDGALRCEISSRDIVQFFRNFDGLGVRDKYVPTLIMQSTKENQCAFLRGLFEDGTVNVKKGKFDHIELTMSGYKVIHQVQAMLLNMGIMSSVRKKKRHDHWSLYIYKYDARLFYDLIGFINEKNNNKLKLAFVNPEQASSKQSFHNLNKKLLNLCVENKIQLALHQRATLRDMDRITDTLLSILVNKLREKGADNNFLNHCEFLLDYCVTDYIASLEDSVADVCCYTVPNGNTFIQNGIYGFNCQGSTIKNVLMVFDFASFKMLSRQLIYTGMTRTSEKCVIVCEGNALLKSCSVDASGNRRTFMSLFLKQLESQESK